ncbi:MAG: hypothetical protein HY527_16300 [Betaproteobacteria bacterium]|nr:hypothetical protein [Betaproteobacteria bacterium]
MGANASTLAVGYADIDAAARRIEGHARRTPVMTSRAVRRQAVQTLRPD